MAKVLRAHCQAKGIAFDKRDMQTVIGIGDLVYKTAPDPLPYMFSCLEALQEHYTIVLYTAGVFEVQMVKAIETGAINYLDGIYIVARKTEDELRKILDIYESKPEDAWMIGNSARSDILPAQKVGLNTIWVQAKTWAYDHLDDDKIALTFMATNLRTVEDILLSLVTEYQAVS